MCPTIRIDDEVYRWLKERAEPFDDTPNSVLRRVANLERSDTGEAQRTPPANTAMSSVIRQHVGRRTPLTKGDELRTKWRMPVLQARFHRDGTFFERPTRFPAALCDRNGYLDFETEDELTNHPQLRVGPKKVNVPRGISSLDGYTQVDDPVR